MRKERNYLSKNRSVPERIYQDENFNVNGFSGKQLEQLIGFEPVDKLMMIYYKRSSCINMM